MGTPATFGMYDQLFNFDSNTGSWNGNSGGFYGNFYFDNPNDTALTVGETANPYDNGTPFFTTVTYTGYDYNSNPIFQEGSDYYIFYNTSPSLPFLPISGTATPGQTLPLCFLEGTHITTPDGEVLVENLNIGDVVSTADGETRKILWIGKHHKATFFTPQQSLPIEICIGALGDNMPKRPLRVSPGHSLLLDGAFPIASALVNGTTVRQLTKDEMPEFFTYYHIEVEDHALILAEGVPAETFLDASSRRQFSNWKEYVELYGEEERNVPPSELHYKRVLKFDDLPQSLKDTLGEPLDVCGEEAA